jgi:hypothetical protein
MELKPFLGRAKSPLNLADFASASRPIQLPYLKPTVPPVDHQYVLRMMLRSPELLLSIPPELAWAEDLIWELDLHQKMLGLNNPFVYFTVRHGVVSSTTDDEWHVDGFSMRVPHVPEQNYVFATVVGTEGLVKSWDIPTDFDPMHHNIHHFFQDHPEGGEHITMEPGAIHLIDPYFVHRRPHVEVGTHRTFWRLSFVPIEIEDDTCTPNPLFPEKRYGRVDIRRNLQRYPRSE